MSDKKPTQDSNPNPGARRKLLKSALLGGGALYMAPERWTRPLIQSVVLPAHAETSSAVLGDGPWSTGDPFTDAGSGGGGGNIASRMVDFLVSPAAAGSNPPPPGQCPFVICIEPTGNGNEIRVRLAVALDSSYRKKTTTPSADLTFKNLKIDYWTLEGSYDAGADRWRGSINGPCDVLIQEGRISGQDSGNLAHGSTFTGERIQVASAGGELRLAGAVEQPPSIDSSWTARQGNCPPLDIPD